MLLDSSFGAGAPKGRGYSLDDVAKYLASLGDKPVMTDVGTVSAREAAKLVISGAVKEVVIFGGVTIRIEGTQAFASEPLPAQGTAEVDLSYSQNELRLVRMADLLLSMGVETTEELRRLLSDPMNALVEAIVTYEKEKKRGTTLSGELKSALFNLLDIVADAVYASEGDRVDAFTFRLKNYERTGEFDEITDHVKHRLHIVRSLQRMQIGVARPVFKTYIESGRHYIIVLDRSGSMGEKYQGVSKKAMAALIALLIARSDPEAKYSLVAFDTSAKILGVRKEATEIVDDIVEIEPGGGTRYASGLAAADKIINEGDVLVIIGDFIDILPIPASIAESLKSKAEKVLLIPVGKADIERARSIARMLGGEVYVYQRGMLTLLS